MDRTYRPLSTVYAALAAVALALAAQAKWANNDEEEERLEYAESEIFFELNDTDGDLGIHALIDGDDWNNLRIEDPNEQKMLNIRVKGRLRRQGRTQLFLESAEPPFADPQPDVFFDRFPPGNYEIEGQTLEGIGLSGKTVLTHAMPAPLAPTVNGEPVAVQCDDEEPGYDAPEVSAPVTIAWPDVTMSHPDSMGGGAGVQPPIGVTIVNYEVVLEVEAEDNGQTYDSIFSVTLPPWENSISIPEEYISQGDTFKYEVLVREESFNQTAVESCFVLVE